MPRETSADDRGHDLDNSSADSTASDRSPANDASPSAPVRHATDSEGQDVESGLARQLSELARHLQAEQSVEALLQRITESAVFEVDAAHDAGISLIVGRKTIETRAATSELVDEIDRVQYDVGQGPCLSSLHEQVTVRADDLATEQRWPRFAAAAVALGIRSMLSVQLFAIEAADQETNMGALNLYSPDPDSFSEHDESSAVMLAAHASIAMQGADKIAKLQFALTSRDVIGQGKGILMERFKISSEEAFHLLVLTSQRTQRKLRDVADDLAATGELNVG